MTPEVRLSPDGRDVAIRNVMDHPTLKWRTSSGLWLTDEEVADWTPLEPVRQVERVTCPWCGRGSRAVTPDGRIRWHHGHNPAGRYDPCLGTGRLPSEYAATAGGAL